MIQIYPVYDSEEHNLEDTTCKCNPEIIFDEPEIIVVHNSFDGREKSEWKTEHDYTKMSMEDLEKSRLNFLAVINEPNVCLHALNCAVEQSRQIDKEQRRRTLSN